MRKVREPAKNEFHEQVDETSSQGTQPMATTRYPKRAMDDADQGSAHGPQQQTAIVRTRNGPHHHHRREPATEAAAVPEGVEAKAETSPGGAETSTNGASLAAAYGPV